MALTGLVISTTYKSTLLSRTDSGSTMTVQAYYLSLEDGADQRLFENLHVSVSVSPDVS
jgi:hypothetical protein